jgi:hypothetical protein
MAVHDKVYSNRAVIDMGGRAAGKMESGCGLSQFNEMIFHQNVRENGWGRKYETLNHWPMQAERDSRPKGIIIQGFQSMPPESMIRTEFDRVFSSRIHKTPEIKTEGGLK